MAKQYKGSLTLDWFNKQKAIINLAEGSIRTKEDASAPEVNWINRDEALFYEISEEDGVGIKPYWVDRDDIRVKEIRPLIFKKAYKTVKGNSEGSIPGIESVYKIQKVTNESEADGIENLLIRGDNLLALNIIKKRLPIITKGIGYRCILIDPPYNIKKAFKIYDDNLEHSEWLTLMRDRLIILRDILAKDGVIIIHIDDKESAYLKVMCDDIFGRSNFVTTFVWETDGNSDNQAKIIGIHEYVHVYAKDIDYLEHPTVFDPNLSEDSKIFRSEIVNTIIKNGIKNPPSTIRLPENFPAQFEKGEIKKEDVNFPKYSSNLVIKDYKLINEVSATTGWSSKNQFELFINSGFKPILDTKRQSTVFKLKKSGAIESIKSRDKGFGYVISVLRNLGNPQSTAKELKELYGLEFDFPKPEFLTSYLLEIFSQQNDYILDCFGGSGTTAAVSQKINRKWTTIELGSHAESHIVPRLKGIISGKDNIGITKRAKWSGGGSFKFYMIGESIIAIDDKTGKGEFNWDLGSEFIQESLLATLDYLLLPELKIFPEQLFKDDSSIPTMGKITGRSKKSTYGIAYLANPSEKNLSITYDKMKQIYQKIKSQKDFHSLTIYTNKGIDIAHDSVPDDLEIIKVPHAIFAELEN
jgi:adenine-specific DNA-methyltransferase